MYSRFTVVSQPNKELKIGFGGAVSYELWCTVLIIGIMYSRFRLALEQNTTLRSLALVGFSKTSAALGFI